MSNLPGVGRPQHASPAPGLAQIRTVAAELARRTGMQDGWPDGVDDLLLRRCHELLAGIKVLEEHAVCRTTSPDEHKPWCPKHSDESAMLDARLDAMQERERLGREGEDDQG